MFNLDNIVATRRNIVATHTIYGPRAIAEAMPVLGGPCSSNRCVATTQPIRIIGSPNLDVDVS